MLHWLISILGVILAFFSTVGSMVHGFFVWMTPIICPIVALGQLNKWYPGPLRSIRLFVEHLIHKPKPVYLAGTLRGVSRLDGQLSVAPLSRLHILKQWCWRVARFLSLLIRLKRPVPA
jgi:hypothetical protein